MYLKNDDRVNLAWSITYIIIGFDSLKSLDCQNIHSDIENYMIEYHNTFNAQKKINYQYEINDVVE